MVENILPLQLLRLDLLWESVDICEDVIWHLAGGCFFAYLALEVLVFLAIIEHLRVVRVGQYFSSISKQNNSTPLVPAESLRFLVQINVVAAVAIIEVMMYTWSTEFSYLTS